MIKGMIIVIALSPVLDRFRVNRLLCSTMLQQQGSTYTFHQFWGSFFFGGRYSQQTGPRVLRQGNASPPQRQSTRARSKGQQSWVRIPTKCGETWLNKPVLIDATKTKKRLPHHAPEKPRRILPGRISTQTWVRLLGFRDERRKD